MKKFIKYSVLLCFAALLLQSAWAAPTAAAQLEARLLHLKTFKTQFVQYIYDEKGTLLQKNKGQLAWKRPARFRWETFKPVEQKIIADGQRLWIYDPDLMQVTTVSLKRALANTPVLFLLGYQKVLERDYRVRIMSSKNKEERFVLRSIKKQASFKQIELFFRQGRLHRMHMFDRLGNRSRVIFSQSKSNLTLPKSLFQFSPPKGVDVIRK